jgi:hypothetical protein
MHIHDDAEVYEFAASEIAAGKPERGILAKAFSAALGEEEKTKALYIQYRVEQLKADAARQHDEDTRKKADAVREQEEEARKRRGGRKAYLAALKKDFTFLVGTKIPESDISSDQFSGIRNSLADAVRLSDVADALAILEFRLVDAVKTGLLDGVIDNNDEWWISKKRG